MNSVKRFIRENKLGEISENKSFREYTTLKVGGKIQLVYFPDTIDNFIRFYEYYRNISAPLFIIGAGSNILASDKEFKGVVVSFRKLAVNYFLHENLCVAYPGCSVVKLAYDLARLGLSGGEFLAGIPATIGGAIYMNAGANGKEIKDILISAKLLGNDGIREYTNSELNFSYRHSRLQNEFLIVLEAKFRFEKEEMKNAAIERIRELKILRKRNQPIEKLSAGCAFQNPLGYSAWELIDKVNLRGYSIGDAQVSEKHSNFLINNGNAKSTEMMELINLIRDKVKQQFGIELKCEWILVNFD